MHILKVSGGTATSLFSASVDGFYESGGSGTARFSQSGVVLAAGDSLLFVVGADGISYSSDSTGLSVQVLLAGSSSGTQVSTYTYDGDGLRRSAQEAGATVPTTFLWDGTDYLMGKN